jgi:hypothetical protein
MNENLEPVRKWLADPASVTQEELWINMQDADSDSTNLYIHNTEADNVKAAYIYTLVKKAAEAANDAATLADDAARHVAEAENAADLADAADQVAGAEAAYAEVKYWVRLYDELVKEIGNAITTTFHEDTDTFSIIGIPASLGGKHDERGLRIQDHREKAKTKLFDNYMRLRDQMVSEGKIPTNNL